MRIEVPRDRNGTFEPKLIEKHQTRFEGFDSKILSMLAKQASTGRPETIEAVFPRALVQTCIVHLIRASLNFVNWKERKSVAADLKCIYRAATVERAEAALAEFRQKYPQHQVVADVWERSWQRAIPFFDFPEEIRKIIYTTE